MGLLCWQSGNANTEGSSKKKKKMQDCLAKEVEPGSTFAAMQRDPACCTSKCVQCTFLVHYYVRQINVMHVTVITFHRETLKLMKLLLCVTST